MFLSKKYSYVYLFLIITIILKVRISGHKNLAHKRQNMDTIVGFWFNDPLRVNWIRLDPWKPGFRGVRGAAIPTVSRGGHAGSAIFNVLRSVNDSRVQASPQLLLIWDFLEMTLYWISVFFTESTVWMMKQESTTL